MHEEQPLSPPPEFSHLIEVDKIPAKGRTFKLSVDPETRAVLATRLDIVALEKLDGKITVRPLAGGPMMFAEGMLEADVVQRCVITLDPLPAHVKERFTVDFGPQDAEEEAGEDREFSLEDPDPPEAIIDGEIDLGELLVQQLALSLDPHPRKSGVDMNSVVEELPEGRKAHIETDAPSGPFADLARLKK